jgi:Integrase core domain
VTKTHSRPYTSTDNPYSEAHFKTLKFRPEFSDRFGSIEQAREFCRGFLGWYNQQHRHSGIALMTPAAVHRGQAPELHAARSRVLQAAFAARPERFVRGAPDTARTTNRHVDQQARDKGDHSPNTTAKHLTRLDRLRSLADTANPTRQARS